jgi:uncharacterized membrane protein YfcA
MPFDLTPLGAVWIAVAVVVAAFVRGYSGFGYSALVIAASSLVMNPLHIVFTVVIGEAVMTLQSWNGIGREVDWRRIRWLMIGAAVGMPAGIAVLTRVPEDWARALVSVYVLTMCLILLAGWRMHAEAGRGPTLGIGVISGLANAPGMGGLPVAAFFAAQPISAPVFRATLAAYFPFLDLYSTPLYWWGGMVTWDSFIASILILPLVFLGNWLGGRRFFAADPQDFRRFAIYLLAGLAALGLGKALV